MDLLKKENGTTIIESLVAIVLLGITLTLASFIILSVMKNNSVLKMIAYDLAKTEINKSMAETPETDSSYTNDNYNLTIIRTVQKNLDIYSTEVSVKRKNSDETIISLKVSYLK